MASLLPSPSTDGWGRSFLDSAALVGGGEIAPADLQGPLPVYVNNVPALFWPHHSLLPNLPVFSLVSAPGDFTVFSPWQ